MKKIKRLIIGIPILILICWLLPLIKNEIVTLRYGSEFIGLQKMTNMIGDVDNLKVLSYSQDTACVYYYDINGGNILEFVRQDSEWEMANWKTIWSKTGSADDFEWPYIYHSAEGQALLLVMGFLYFVFAMTIYIVADLKNKIKL